MWAGAAVVCALFAAHAEERTVAAGETLKFDLQASYNSSDSVLAVEDGGCVHVEQAGEYKCRFDLRGESAVLEISGWNSDKTLSGKILGAGTIRCANQWNNRSWNVAPATKLTGDLSDFSGRFELNYLSLDLSSAAGNVNASAVTGQQRGIDQNNNDPTVGAGFVLGSKQTLSVGWLDGRIWVRGADATSCLAVSGSTGKSSAIAVGPVGLKTLDETAPLPLLMVTNDAVATVWGGDFIRIEGTNGIVRIADGTTHIYKPVPNVNMEVLAGGTLEFGNTEVLSKVDPALWLDASKAETLDPYTVGGKEIVYTNNSAVIRRWSDCRAKQTKLYGLNPFGLDENGSGVPSQFPYLLSEGCNGKDVLSFGRGAVNGKVFGLDSQWGRVSADGTPFPSGVSEIAENRRLPFNKAVGVKWAIMVYSAQNNLVSEDQMYLSGFCPGQDVFGPIRGFQSVFNGSEESEWSSESVSQESVKTAFMRGWQQNNTLKTDGTPVWLDGEKVAYPSSMPLSGGFQVLTIDARLADGSATVVRALGTRTDDGQNCGGQTYGEMLLFSDELTDVQRLAIEAYLGCKWRLPGLDFSVSSLSVEAGGNVLAGREGLPVGLAPGLAFAAKDGKVVNPMNLPDVEMNAAVSGAISLAFDKANPKIGRYPLVSAKKLDGLKPEEWEFATTPAALKGRKVELVWEKNDSGDYARVYAKVEATGFSLSFR
ncbi:MAG TPA: hypothetical protein DD637_04015 [Verrucomicrobia bacterium]|nr:hypothetical protein [Verrucomicrobiota bacterium]